MSQDRPHEHDHLNRSSQKPLTLESIGIVSGEQEVFMHDAQRRGLIIDQVNLRNSTIVKVERLSLHPEPPGKYTNDERLVRLYLATGLETILRSGVFDDQNTIQDINSTIAAIKKKLGHRILKQDPTKDVDKLATLTDELMQRITQAFETLPITLNTQSQEDAREAELLYYRVRGDFQHDTSGIFGGIRAHSNMSNFRPEPKEILNDLNDIERLWLGGEVMETTKLVIQGYQEEVIPGWTERSCNIRNVMSLLTKKLASRFGLTLSFNGQQLLMSDKAGAISVDIDALVPGEVPIAPGSIERILWNLMKNAAKAKEVADRGKTDTKPLEFKLGVKNIGGNILISLKDNGPGFDLNVPLAALAKLAELDHSFLQQISADVSPQVAEMIQAYIGDKKPFAIYPLTLEQLFDIFLVRRLSGSLVTETRPEMQTSGVGLASVKGMLTTLYKGDIWVTNHPDGGAFTLIAFPTEENAESIRDQLQSLQA